MRLQAVTVCVRYADFLAQTVSFNRSQFDRWLIVTTPEDLETQAICEFWDLEMVLTDSFQTRWGEMHKARGINDALSILKLDESWVLHVDADIALPPKARSLLERADLDKSVIYGADRLRVPSYEDWDRFRALPVLQHDGYHVKLDAFESMHRFNGWNRNGYAPVGFFQLWHPQISGVRDYPADHINGDKTDVLFAAQWPRNRRALLPEFAVYHLESEAAPQGTNWGGRKTCRFGPEPDLSRLTGPRTEGRRHRHRHHHHHHWPYGWLAAGESSAEHDG